MRRLFMCCLLSAFLLSGATVWANGKARDAKLKTAPAARVTKDDTKRGKSIAERWDKVEKRKAKPLKTTKKATKAKKRSLRHRPIATTGVRTTPMRFRGLDRDHDGRITRDEWRGSDVSFRVHDWNGDGVLSGIEVRPGARRPSRR